MFDLPMDVAQKPKVEIHYTMPSEVSSPILDEAKRIVSELPSGFSWSAFLTIFKETLIYVYSLQDLSEEERKSKTVEMLSYIIDLTDTPYLPDNITDPAFKALLPPIVDLISKSYHGIISNRSLEDFTSKQEKSLGFEWTDVIVYVESTVAFVMKFPSLSAEEKKVKAIEMTNEFIDTAPLPLFTGFFARPVLKAFLPVVISFCIEELHNFF